MSPEREPRFDTSSLGVSSSDLRRGNFPTSQGPPDSKSRINWNLSQIELLRVNEGDLNPESMIYLYRLLTNIFFNVHHDLMTKFSEEDIQTFYATKMKMDELYQRLNRNIKDAMKQNNSSPSYTSKVIRISIPGDFNITLNEFELQLRRIIRRIN